MGKKAAELKRAYETLTAASKARMSEAARYLPGGDTRSSAHYPPYPAFMTRGEGIHLHDVDGNRYVDFMNNFTSLIHGHAHPPTVQAVSRQMAAGSAYAAPTDSQVELARLLCERVPGIDELRFCSCGTEATMMALRAARAFTGKQKVLKIEGGYNGSHDIGEMSLVPLLDTAGPLEAPATVLTDRSIARSAAGDVVVTPFNRPQVTRRQLQEQGGEIAALIVEPMLGALGMVAPQPGYLQSLRDMTFEHGVLLVFDEVITLRLSTGGLQAQEGVVPDLTALGKIIGGGLPVGAFGGRRDIMEMFNPSQSGSIMHAGTFCGNPLTMAAGLATLETLRAADVERINGLGDRLRTGFDQAFAEAGLRGCATGLGSLSHVHFTDGPVRDARDSMAAVLAAGELPMLLHLGMLRRGVFPAGRQMYSISTPMTEQDVDAAVAAFAETLTELRAVAEEERPQLLIDAQDRIGVS